MDTVEPQLSSETSASSQRTSTVRLVIRARILPDPPPERPAAQQPSRNKDAPALVIGIVLAILFTALALRMLWPDSPATRMVDAPTASTVSRPETPTRATNEGTSGTQERATAKRSPPAIETAWANVSANQPISPQPTRVSWQPPSSVNEVIPDAPHSALQTIRGTVRVAVRVIINPDGTVRTATSEDAGPSRYFERLSLEAAQRWTFTPSASNEDRSMLLRFHFTRTGATAKAEATQ